MLMTLYWVNNPKLCDKLSKLIRKKFEISMMNELTLFIRLQVKNIDNEMENFSVTTTPMSSSIKKTRNSC